MNPDLSLLDANLVRSREGLRVLEDTARFVLHNNNLAQVIKNLRHSIRAVEANFGGSVLLIGRDRGEKEPSEPLPSEQSRSNLLHIVRANAGRVSEALRNLEEFAKIYAPELTQAVSKIRYTLYQIELDLAHTTPHWWLEWYNIAGFIYPLSADPLELIDLIKHGARVVQLRDKDSSKNIYTKKLETLLTFTSIFNRSHDDEKVLVFVNDHIDIAARYPVAGLHLGQTDGNIAVARRIIGANKIIGRSNNTLEQVRQSVKNGSDYVSFGPIFATPTKPDRIPTGLPALEKAVAFSPVPLVAIGGIDMEKIGDIYGVGAKNAAVVRSGKQFFS